jgi:hypothetical protein
MVSLETWNARVLDVVQALCGSISPNFRMVSLAHEHGEWIVSVVLERDDESDREEIDEVASAFDALQSTDVPRRFEVFVDGRPLPWPKPPVRVVFRRREVDDA